MYATAMGWHGEKTPWLVCTATLKQVLEQLGRIACDLGPMDKGGGGWVAVRLPPRRIPENASVD